MKSNGKTGQIADEYSNVKAGATEKRPYNSQPIPNATEHELNISKSGQHMEGIVEEEGVNKGPYKREESVKEKKSYNSIPQKNGGEHHVRTSTGNPASDNSPIMEK